MITAEQIKQANETCKAIPIGRNKNYVEVNERIKAFRSVFPDGSILNELLKADNGQYIVKTQIIIDGVVVAEGHAEEKETAKGVNSTSALENCETSAVGRALAFLGIGVDEAIASAQEVQNAIKQQDDLQQNVSKEEAEELKKLINDNNINQEKLLEQFKKKKIEDFKKGELLAIKNYIAKLKGDKNE